MHERRYSIKISLSEASMVAFFFELNLKKKRWLGGCPYNPNKEDITHLESLSRNLALH